MSSIRYTEEFKRDAVAQVTERGYSVLEVSRRLGISSKSLYDWKKAYHKPEPERQKDALQSSEIRRLKAELARVAEERDILKKVPEILLGSTSQEIAQNLWGEVRLHQGTSFYFPGSAYVPDPQGSPQRVLYMAQRPPQHESQR